ncbi:thiol-disulfide oxidoreductase DCC family protein [Peribacillus sp. FSL H8-0477]|uniref:thiol-disulfide oxidoreductase DCC family protein n=1 Tax=Peribacillus sp. FSL H8-0477 TaxID=2921388 RepID=UPI0030FC6EEE
MKKIILFDGECNFCDKSVQFIIKRDPEAIFSFTSQQGEAGQQMIKKHHAPSSVDSIILIENDTYYLKSSAALRICRHLQGAWKLLFIFILVPYPIRDFFYNILAKNRYKWFGKKDQCTLPTPEVRKRFL